MREFPPWRSLVWLAAPALLVAACTPRLDLDNRPPPCASGFALCAPTGVCVPPDTLDDVCPFGLDLRQGGTVVAPVPGASAASDITATSSWPDLETNVRATPEGSFFVEVTAPHGTRLGDTDPNGSPYTLRIATKLAGVTTLRDIRLIVSPVAVSSSGDDLAAGTGLQPFRTLKQAADVARLGDTISLLLTKAGVFFDPNNSTKVTIRDGVTIEGQTPIPRAKDQSTPVQVPMAKVADPPRATQPPFLDMPLELEGDATISNVQLGRRLVIQAHDRVVALRAVAALAGITVEASATTAHLAVSGGSILPSEDNLLNPLLIEADDVSVALDLGASVTYNGMGELETVLSTGNKTTLQVRDDSRVITTIAPVAIRLEGEGSSLELDGRTMDKGKNVYIQGQVQLVAPTSSATISHATFQLSSGVGGIIFQGSEMTVQDSELLFEGITQTAPRSSVTVRRTSFSLYKHVAYYLQAGRLDLGTKLDPGGNSFRRTTDAGTSPTALRIDAPKDGWSSVWSSKTTFEGIEPMELEIMGPAKSDDGLYDISTTVTLDFFDVQVP